MENVQLTACVTGLLFSSCSSTAGDVESGLVSLFDGKTLDGWVTENNGAGFNPMQAQILTKIGGAFVLLPSIGAMIVPVNRKDLMGTHRAGTVLNIGLVLSFLFSIHITYTGCVAIADRLRYFCQG